MLKYKELKKRNIKSVENRVSTGNVKSAFCRFLESGGHAGTCNKSVEGKGKRRAEPVQYGGRTVSLGVGESASPRVALRA